MVLVFKIFFVCIAFVCIAPGESLYDKNPGKQTKSDLAVMKNFDKLSYSITDTKIKSLHVGVIYNYILKNLNYKLISSKLVINLKGSAGYSNAFYNYSTNGVTNKNKMNAIIGLNFTYPIFDQKTEKARKQQIITVKNNILSKLEKYVLNYNKYITYKRQLSYQRLLQLRSKLQVKSGIKFLEDRLKILKAILNLQSSLADTKTELQVYKNILLNYVIEDKKRKLESLLK